MESAASCYIWWKHRARVIDTRTAMEPRLLIWSKLLIRQPQPCEGHPQALAATIVSSPVTRPLWQGSGPV